MNWQLSFLPEAKKDLKKLDKNQQIIVLKAIRKVQQNPLSNNEGGYGKPLGNKADNNLTGLLKIKLRGAGIRIVYKLIKIESKIIIIVIGIRDDNEVYDIASRRINKK